MKNKSNTIAQEESAGLIIAGMSVLGDREEQQDCFGFEIVGNKALAAVCDGMGGHRGGRIASSKAIQFIFEEYKKKREMPALDEDAELISNIQFLHDTTVSADDLISHLTDEKGNPLMAGSTMVMVLVDERRLFWSSVGDSRLYLFRNGEFLQMTVDHNYREYLKEQLSDHKIDKNEYDVEKEKGEALLSYLGVNGLQLINHNIKPFSLLKDDLILIVTDGLYKILDSEEIVAELKSCNRDLRETIIRLNQKSAQKAKMIKKERDNTTIVLFRIR